MQHLAKIVTVGYTSETPAIDTRRYRRASAIFALALVFIFFASILNAVDEPSLKMIILVAVIFFVGALPMYFFLRKGLVGTFPLMSFHSMFYAVSFGLVALTPAIVSRNIYFTITDIETVLYLTILGLAELYFGYYVVGRVILKNIKPFKFYFDESPQIAEKIGWTCLGVFFVLLPISKVIELTTIYYMIAPMREIALALFALLFLQRKLSVLGRVAFLIVLLPSYFIEAFASSQLAWVFTSLILLSSIYMYVRKRIPYFIVIFATLFFFFFQPVKNQYRQILWSTEGERMSNLELSAEFVDLAMQHAQGQNMDTSDFFLTSSYRLNHLSTFAAIWRATPERVKFFMGETYAPMMTKFIPRDLWPEKPNDLLGTNGWALRYGFINSTKTAYNLPWLPEFYMNFGITGIVFGMLLVGIFLKFLTVKFCTIFTGPLSYAFGLAIVMHVVFVESCLSMKIGGVFYTWVLGYIFISLINGYLGRKSLQ